MHEKEHLMEKGLPQGEGSWQGKKKRKNAHKKGVKAWRYMQREKEVEAQRRGLLPSMTNLGTVGNGAGGGVF